MINIVQNLGVQSYCYHDIRILPELVKAIKATGVTRMEFCESQISFADRSQHAPKAKILMDAGLKIVSTGVNRIPVKEEDARPYFEFLKLVGAHLMSVTFDINTLADSLRTAEKLAEEFDVKLAVHNHGGYDVFGNTGALEWLFKQTSPRIGLMLDTAWAIHSHGSPYPFIRQFSKRLYGIHFKDFSFDRAGNYHDECIGEGNLNLAELRKTLEDVDFQGEPILEFEGDPSNPVPALKKSVDAIRKAMA